MGDAVRGQIARERPGTTASGLAARVVLAWVDCYTGWVSAETAERRRAEISSDLWEQQADARDTGAPPFAASLSIARRAALGAPADLLWVQTQRAASRGLPAEQKARSMNTATRLLARWWWVLGAAVLAAWGFTMATGQLLQPGMPYLEGTIHAYLTSTAMVIGVVLRARMPRTAATLIAAGAVTFASLWWAPAAMIIGAAVVIGGMTEVVRRTPRLDPLRAIVAVVGVLAIGAAPMLWGLLGYESGPWGLSSFALAAVGTALVVSTGTRGRSAAGPRDATPTGARTA